MLCRQNRELAAFVHAAVATGGYAPRSKVIRDALRDWARKRGLRQQGVTELREVWREARQGKSPGVSADDVLDRLELRHQAIADAAGSAEP